MIPENQWFQGDEVFQTEMRKPVETRDLKKGVKSYKATKADLLDEGFRTPTDKEVDAGERLAASFTNGVPDAELLIGTEGENMGVVVRLSQTTGEAVQVSLVKEPEAGVLKTIFQLITHKKPAEKAKKPVHLKNKGIFR